MNSCEILNFPVPTLGGLPDVNLSDEEFGRHQRSLAYFNRDRLTPGIGHLPGEPAQARKQSMEIAEKEFVEALRFEISHLVHDVPSDPEGFIAWFESLRVLGPGQRDPLFPWLAESSSRDEMRWFLAQEVGGEAGFDDLVAMTQVKMPVRAKLEMARNYWDEMGRGHVKGMHGLILDRLAKLFDIHPDVATTVPEALALANMMVALAYNRRYAFHSVGALGVIEMTAPGRSVYVLRGLERLGVPKKHSLYFALHAVLDIKHSTAWNHEVLRTLVAEDGRRAQAIAEGAVLRLWCGARCFSRYRQHLLRAL